MSMHYGIYGLGSGIMDIQVEIEERDIERLDLCKGEMRLVSSEQQQLLLSELNAAKISKSSGGSAANSMILFQQLGGCASYCCLTGDDEIGQAYRKEMKEIGVDMHTSPQSDGVTATCLVMITPDAERTMNTHLGISANLSACHVDEDRIARSDWVYIEGYLLSQPNSYEATIKALEYAKRHGTRCAISFSDGFIVDCFRDQLSEVVSRADLIFANLNEAMKYTNSDNPDAAFSSLSALVSGVALTLGSDGVRVAWQGQEYFEPAMKVKAVDTTGAGDAFAGAFLYGLSREEMSVQQVSRLGCLLAGRAVSQMGARLSGDIAGDPSVQAFCASLTKR